MRELRQKDSDHRKLNESIMLSYKHTDDRDQTIVRSIRDITKKHQEEIAKLKCQHQKETRQLEIELKGTR